MMLYAEGMISFWQRMNITIEYIMGIVSIIHCFYDIDI